MNQREKQMTPSIDDVREIVDYFSLKIDEPQIKSISEKLAQVKDFNMDRVKHILGLRDKIRIKDIINAFYAKNRKREDGCELCRDGWLPIFDSRLYHISGNWPIDHVIRIPKADCPCPICGSEPGRYAARTKEMSAEDIAWTYIVLYEYWIYHRQNTTHPAHFEPKDIWGLEIEPFLSEKQTKMMEWIFLRAVHNREANTQANQEAVATNKAIAHNTNLSIQSTIPF